VGSVFKDTQGERRLSPVPITTHYELSLILLVTFASREYSR
jgi:hypothetical protein